MQFLLLAKDLILDKNLTGNEYKIYTYLLFLYNEEKQCSYPSIEVISERLNISVSTVKRSIKKLEKLGYMTIEKKKGLAGNYNVYKKLKHLIGAKVAKKVKAPKVGVDSNGEQPIDGQISVEEALQEIEKNEVEESVVEVNALDNNSNVRLARSVVNVDKSGFAKKVISLANTDLLRTAIKEFKNKRGKSATFLIELLVDQYYKNEISLSGALFNLLKGYYIYI